MKQWIALTALAAAFAAQAATPPTSWVDMGQATVTDDLTTLYEDYDQTPTYQVTVQKDAAGSGWYRLVNPFANHPSVDDWFNLELAEDEDAYYLLIDATNPDNVTIPECEIGLSAYGDSYKLISCSLYPNPNSIMADDEISLAGGKLKDGVITFADPECLAFISTYGGETTNVSGLFKVVLPDAGTTPEQPTPQSLPFTEAFANDSFTQTFTILDVNDDGTKWTPYLGSAQVSYNSDLAMDDWLITPPLAMEAGKKYTVSIDVMTGNGSNKETFEVMAGNAPTAAALTTTVIARADIAHTSYKTYTGVFSPAADGAYYVGIHGCSAADKYSISVKNLSITAGAEASAPAAPTDLTVTTHTYGALKADISVKAPAKDLADNTLEALEAVTLYRDGEKIHTFETPAPGAVLKFTDQVPACSRYKYSATATANGMESTPIEVSEFVGVLEPVAPETVDIADGTEPGTVTLTWAAADTDIRGNQLQPEYVTYRIYVGGTSTPLVKDITATTYTLQALEEGQERAFVRYEVVAETAGGISGFATSDSHPAGKPYTVPYTESFANGAEACLMANHQDNTARWSAMADDDAIQAQDGDNGFAGSTASYTDDVATWHTHKIAIENLRQPALALYVYSLGSDWQGDASALDISVKEGNIVTPLKKVTISELPGDEGWKEIVCPLTDFDGHTVQLAFTATHDEMPYIFIDNVKVYDVDEAGITTPAIAVDNATAEYYNLQGVRIPAGRLAPGVYIVRQGNTATKVLVK